MRRSDLKHAQEICELLFELTRGNIVEINPFIVRVRRYNSSEKDRTYPGKSLVECLRAAKADEPNKEPKS